MSKKQITAALTALVLGATTLGASAQPMPPGHGPHGPGAPKPGPAPVRPAPMPPAPKPPAPMPPAYKHPAPPPPVAHPGHPHGMPPGHAKRMGSGPQYNWTKGSRVPPQYRSHHYVVNDWRKHGLKAPPRGYQWIQYGSDYLLVAVATGLIAQLILSH